jgi:hypothetical protein
VINKIGSVGIESRNSTRRDVAASKKPPKKPANAPRSTPINSEKITTRKAIVSETRAP